MFCNFKTHNQSSNYDADCRAVYPPSDYLDKSIKYCADDNTDPTEKYHIRSIRIEDVPRSVFNYVWKKPRSMREYGYGKYDRSVFLEPQGNNKTAGSTSLSNIWPYEIKNEYNLTYLNIILLFLFLFVSVLFLVKCCGRKIRRILPNFRLFTRPHSF